MLCNTLWSDRQTHQKNISCLSRTSKRRNWSTISTNRFILLFSRPQSWVLSLTQVIWQNTSLFRAFSCFNKYLANLICNSLSNLLWFFKSRCWDKLFNQSVAYMDWSDDPWSKDQPKLALSWFFELHKYMSLDGVFRVMYDDKVSVQRFILNYRKTIVFRVV